MNKSIKKMLLFLIFVFLLISIVNASNVNDNKTDDSIENNENIISDSNLAIDDNVKENTSKNNVFDSNSSYGANTFETTLNLTKRETKFWVNNIANVQYLDNVSITGKYLDKEGNYIQNTNVILKYNNQKYVVKTNRFGEFNYSIKTSKVGNNSFTLSSEGNTKYAKALETFSFDVAKKDTLIVFDVGGDVQYGDMVRLNGSFTTIDGLALRYTPLLVKLNSNIYRTVTDTNGCFTYDVKAINLGTNNVVIFYYGNARFASAFENASFNVSRKDTLIVFDVDDDVQYSDRVHLKGSYTTIDGLALRYTPLLVKLNSNIYRTVTDTNGCFTYDVKAINLGTNNVVIFYYGNARFAPANNTQKFEVTRKTTRIQLKNKTLVEYGKYLNITGRYEDTSSNSLRYTPLIIKINNITYITKTDNEGYFSYNYLINRLGNNTLTVTYPGNARYVGATNSTTFLAIKINEDLNKEIVITKTITTTNGKPDISKLGLDYQYVDENGTYTIAGEEIVRVKKLDSYCQQIYGFTPKYTFFRELNSNFKYIISREKWNVIARALNSYHVKQGYNSVATPYAITVNLTGKIRYYPVYYDAQEYINGHRWTCGPTSMSMISQALNCYSSEKKLAGVYSTTSSAGTDEEKIISRSPSVHMKLTNIVNNKTSVIKTLQSGKMVFWHISGHYMCILGYNSQTDRFLCLNPSGLSHNIQKVQWATWTEVRNTDKALKGNGFMAVTSCWTLNSTMKTYVKNYYNNMGGKYIVPNNNEDPNSGDDNIVRVIVTKP